MKFSSTFWRSQRVLVPGGAGFVGSFVVDKLQKLKTKHIFVPRSKEYDLRNRAVIETVFTKANPTMVINLAAICGGIGANRAAPGQFFFDNAIMGIQLMETARRFGVKKFVQIGTVCAYPKWTPTPFKEDDLWNGYPEATNAPYGLAKKMLLVQAQAYRQQYGFNGIYLLPTNIYGPRDHFDIEKSHVLPALILKIYQAKKEDRPEVEVWGTGKPTREFLYVEDAAEGILLAAQHYNAPDPVNIGSGQTIRIRDLVDLIATFIGYKGRIVWNNTKPDGQPKRLLDSTRAQKAFGFRSKISLEKGLRQAIDWYVKYESNILSGQS